MPTSLMDLPDELLQIICNLFAPSLDETIDSLLYGWTYLNARESEDREALLSLCLTSKRLRGAARPALHFMVQPSCSIVQQHQTRYLHRLSAANLQSCRSLVLPIGSGNEFILLRGLFFLQRLHLSFDKHLNFSFTSASQIFLELSTRPSIKILSLCLEGIGRRETYIHSLLRVVTYLHHLRDLYIGGYPSSFVASLTRNPASSSPPRLDRLRISYIYEPAALAEALAAQENEDENGNGNWGEDGGAQEIQIEVDEAEIASRAQIGVPFLPVGALKDMEFVQIEATMLWTRKSVGAKRGKVV